MKQLSCGIIITDNINILLGHVTRTKYYDIAKGGQDEDETYLQTAKRELLEEFNLEFNDYQFEEWGLFTYTKKKDLYLYKIVVDCLYKDINLNSLKCSTYVEDKDFKEMDFYRIVQIKFIENYCYPSMVKVLNKIFEKS